jgi:hypothetical protein
MLQSVQVRNGELFSDARALRADTWRWAQVKKKAGKLVKKKVK